MILNGIMGKNYVPMLKINGGGEGDIYLLRENQNYVAKIFKPECRNAAREEKLRQMVRVRFTEEQLKQIKAFNYEHIYRNKRLLVFHEYARLVLTKLFETLYEAYCGAKTIDELAKMAHIYPELAGSFGGWLMRYCSFARRKEYGNRKIYGTLETDKIYARAILDYISGMTDGYAIKIFNELISY